MPNCLCASAIRLHGKTHVCDGEHLPTSFSHCCDVRAELYPSLTEVAVRLRWTDKESRPAIEYDGQRVAELAAVGAA